MENIFITKVDLETMSDEDYIKFINVMKSHTHVVPDKNWRFQRNRQVFRGKYIDYPKNKFNLLEWDYLFDQAFWYTRVIDGVSCTIKVIETADGFRCSYNTGGHYRDAYFASGWRCDSSAWEEWFDNYGI